MTGAKMVRRIFATIDNGNRIRRKGKLTIANMRRKNPDQLKEKSQVRMATMISKASMKGEIVGETCSAFVAATTVEVGSEFSDMLLVMRSCDALV
jgi:hypothetical protein